MNYRLHYLKDELKECGLFLLSLPLLIFPPAWLLFAACTSRPCSGKEGDKRTIKVFALIPERVNGKWHWLRKYDQEETYQQVGHGPWRIRVMGWRKS